MDNLYRLKKQKQEMIKRHQRERQDLDDQILKEEERIKMRKEAEKRKKEQAKRNKITGGDSAYQSFVRDSMTIAELNKILENFLNEE